MFYHFLLTQKQFSKKNKKEKEIYIGDIIINLNKIHSKHRLKILKKNSIDYGYMDYYIYLDMIIKKKRLSEMSRIEKNFIILQMFKKYLEYRFITLYIIPFILGILSTLSFQPFNFILINLIIFPIIFYLIIY